MSWKWSDATFPAGTWTLTYTLVSPKGRIQITASADGSDHLVEVTTAISAAYLPGEYKWQAHVSDGASERYKVGEGFLSVVADFATKTSFDARSHVKRVLDALNAVIERRASKTQMSQAVDGIQISHMSLADQIQHRDRYAMKYQKERAAKAGTSPRRTVAARFVN